MGGVLVQVVQVVGACCACGEIWKLRKTGKESISPEHQFGPMQLNVVKNGEMRDEYAGGGIRINCADVVVCGGASIYGCV